MPAFRELCVIAQVDRLYHRVAQSRHEGSQHINDFDLEALQDRAVLLNQHCYGCTAGAGSSCGGEIA